MRTPLSAQVSEFLYLSSYAAYSFYGLIGMGAAFVLLLIVTLGGVALALSYDSKALVGYGFIGAFIIPLVLPLSTSVHVLFIYLAILNVGVLLTARFKIWPEFTVASLIGSCLLFLDGSMDLIPMYFSRTDTRIWHDHLPYLFHHEPFELRLSRS
jgi:uncharacterized membrane protein